MITYALINLILIFVNLFLSILPKIEIVPSAFEPALEWIFGQVGRFNGILPVEEILNCCIICIIFELNYFLIRLILGLIKLIRGADVNI